MEMLKWMWRGLITRLGLMAGEIPPPPHRRNPEVSAHFQVEPIEEHDLPPTASGEGDEAKHNPQAHPHPAERRGSMQN
ncbi:MAG: hypothetical protein WCI61_07285 [Chloroflexota bacterium]